MADNNVLLRNMTDLGVLTNTNVANLKVGAQLGVGLYAPNLDAATPLVLTPTVLVVMQTPTMYNNRPNMSSMIKAVIEGHPRAVSGIDFGYTLETSPTPVGHDGQNLLVPTKAKRSEVSPSFVFQEVTGNLIWNMFRQWLTDIQNPDTNASFAQIEDPGAYVMSTYSMSMLAIQFDPTMLPENIIDAAFYTNMFPLGTGDLGLERTIATSKAIERTINMSALVQHNDQIRAMAVTVAEQLQIVKADYTKATPYRSDVESSLTKFGYQFEAGRAIDEFKLS